MPPSGCREINAMDAVAAGRREALKRRRPQATLRHALRACHMRYVFDAITNAAAGMHPALIEPFSGSAAVTTIPGQTMVRHPRIGAYKMNTDRAAIPVHARNNSRPNG